ncbi:MAG: hypothetical protein ACF8NJ_10685, partial [Phycisphaerales bacterium JB038]
MILKTGRTHAVCVQVQRQRLLRETLLLAALACLAAACGWLAATWRPVPTLAALEQIAASPEIKLNDATDPALVPETTSASTDVRSFDGRPLRAVGTMTMVVTAYSPDARSCGK